MLRFLAILLPIFLFSACKSVLYNYDGYRKTKGKIKIIQEYKNGPEYEVKVGKWTYFSCDTIYANGTEKYDRNGRLHGKVTWYNCDSLPRVKAKYNHGYRIGLYQDYHFAEGYLQEEIYYAKMPDSLKGSVLRWTGYAIWGKEYDSEGNVIKEWKR